MRKINFYTHAILRNISIYISLLFTHVMMHLCPWNYLISYTIQLTFFLHKPTYSCHKLQIPKLRTIDEEAINIGLRLIWVIK